MAAKTGLSIEGTKFLYNGKPFYYQGVSFFNALYNEELNRSAEIQQKWLRKLKSWGITALRVWGDYRVTNKWIDEGPDHSLYVYPEMQHRDMRFEPSHPQLIDKSVQRVKDLCINAEKVGTIIELVLFSHYRVYPVGTRDAFVKLITKELRPFRNMFFEVWNEYDETVLRHYETIKLIDADRLVGNSPGGSGVLKGFGGEYSVIDILLPHTSRRVDRFWEVAPIELKGLLETHGKPVIDDEPARIGTSDFGGRPDTTPEQHIAQMEAVRKYGGYSNYHHDMFQMPYGNPTIPDHGIPDPEFSPFHKQAFDYLKKVAPREVTGAK